MYSKFNKGLFTDLVEGIKTIDKPVNQSQLEEAKLVGLELLKRSNNPNYNFYKFTECNHTAFLQPTHVRRNNFECKTCQHEKVVNLAYVSDDQILFRTKPNTYMVLRKCGHIVETATANLGTTRQRCSLCFEDSLKDSAERHGYVYIGSEGGSYRKIMFKGCQHEKIVQFSQIVKGNAVCRECQELEYKKQAEQNGLVLLSRTKDRYAVYKLPCGCQKELRIDHVAGDSWICDVHNESHYTKPSMVYLLEIVKDGFSWLKLGFAKNLELRTNGYGLKDSTVAYVKTVPFETGRKAMLFEKALHSKLKEKRLAKDFMKKYHTFSGHTECYPIELKELLITYLDSAV